MSSFSSGVRAVLGSPRGRHALGASAGTLIRAAGTIACVASESWWWVLLVPAVTVPGALLRGFELQKAAQGNRESPPAQGHWRDVLPASSSPPLPPPLPPRRPPPHPLPPPPQRLAEPEPPAARTHATADSRRPSTLASTKPHAGRQRQQPPQPEGRLRHQTPEGRLRHA
eukprot:scaffold34017_cov51-Phaeocystis_antarctica.AAC.1